MNCTGINTKRKKNEAGKERGRGAERKRIRKNNKHVKTKTLSLNNEKSELFRWCLREEKKIKKRKKWKKSCDLGIKLCEGKKKTLLIS